MVQEVRSDYPSEYSAIEAVEKKLGIRTPETVRKWIRRAEVDSGQWPGLTTAEHEQIKALKKANAELRRANEILKAASASSRQARPPQPLIMRFIDTMRADGHAVESVCQVLRRQGCQVAARTYRAWRTRPPAARTVSDAHVVDAVRAVAWTVDDRATAG
jgi:transposase